ncbi:FAD dependent oxidoreductase [Stemphylium lycopersici]|uniref:FAD dependent oxidoreductase n=1 Tax=Stemphylium lycopersici TaxID=183478 RepID=A0A364NDW7_STELY|nr:FAD dependent oxidoreductase [Stemphylium lycopersici]
MLLMLIKIVYLFCFFKSCQSHKLGFPTLKGFGQQQQALPPPKDELPKTDTVIVGAGVIGLATAFQLVLAHTETAGAKSTLPGGTIVVVERAAHICPAASGQATGGLGDFGFSTGVADLGILSYDLLQKVAFPGGPAEFGFSESTVYRIIPGNFTGTPKPADDWGPTPPVEQPLSALPDWVQPKKHWSVQRMSGPPHASHLLLNISCRSLVLAAGPWSPRVFSTLFPNATLQLPMNSTASAGNHFRIRTPGWKPEDDRKGSEQVFFQNDALDGQGLDITSFLGGELYVGGWGAIPEELPERAESIQAQPSEIESMKALTKQYLRIPEDDELEIFAVGRCYRPFANLRHPIITKVNWDLLGVEKGFRNVPRSSNQIQVGSDCNHSKGGLYLNTGHFGDGVALSMGSGKITSELLLGLVPSIDVSGLGLS